MNNYLLSIIIPTRNRQMYCQAAINQILDHNWEGVEVCIQDNSENGSLGDWVRSMDNKSITYNYHPGTLSFVDNFSEAVSLAHGEFLCMIGDDDGILPTILDLVNQMQRNDTDAAIPALNFIYSWPSKQHIVDDSESGTLLAHLYAEEISKSPRVIKSGESGLIGLLRSAVQNYYEYDIPRLYHGIVRRSILDKIKETTGHYFGGLTPDMYMAVALSLTCNKIIRVNYSVTISGICPKSGSADSATGRHTGELKDAPHFRGHDKYEWDELIPSFYSVDTIWSDTLLNALKEFGRRDLISKFNISLFLSLCINRYPNYREIVLSHAEKNRVSITMIKVNFVTYRTKMFIKRCIAKIQRTFFCKGLGNSNKIIRNLPDIKSAENAILEILRAGRGNQAERF